MTWQQILYWVEIAGVCGVTPATLIGAFCYCWKSYKKLLASSEKLDALMLELKPNGGSSLRDAINRIESKVCTIDFMNRTYWNEHSDIALFSCDTAGKCNWVNKKYLELFDTNSDSLMGYGWENFVEQKQRKEVRETWENSLEDEHAFEMQYNIITHKGKKLEIKCKAYGSKKTGYLGFIEEVK